jgi:hypothetical protein
MYANGCIETSAASSTFSLNGTGDEEEFVCERCHVSETQLKEALDELSSAQTTINILQNELLASKTSTSTYTEDHYSTERPGNKPTPEVWTLLASKNNRVKSQDHDKPNRTRTTSSGCYVPTANRFSPFSNLKGTFVEQCEAGKNSECTYT